MYKAAVVAVTVLMIACGSPLISMAQGGPGHGQGAGRGTGVGDGSGPVRDHLRDGSCALVNTMDKNTIAANGRGGRKNGPRDGSGPRRDGSGGGTCPYSVS